MSFPLRRRLLAATAAALLPLPLFAQTAWPFSVYTRLPSPCIVRTPGPPKGPMDHTR